MVSTPFVMERKWHLGGCGISLVQNGMRWILNPIITLNTAESDDGIRGEEKDYMH